MFRKLNKRWSFSRLLAVTVWCCLLATAVVVSGWLALFWFCWAVTFMVGIFVEEDQNHWDWPKDNGPGMVTYLRIAVLTGGVVGLLCSVGWWLFAR